MKAASSILLLLYACKYCYSSSDGNSCGDVKFDIKMFKMSKNGDFMVYWKEDDKDITFKAIVKTRGYIGFGFANYDSFEGADVVVGGFKDGKGYITDRHVKDDKAVVDKNQDWSLLDACEDDSSTTLIFTRKIVTCDDEDLSVTTDTMRIVSFSGDQDLQNPNEKVSIKTNLQVTNRYLLGIFPNYDPADLQVFTVQAENTLIPTVDTTYWCTMRKLPRPANKNHIIMIEPYFVPESNYDLIHHGVLYLCFNLTQDEIKEYLDKTGFECGNHPEPVYFKCNGALFSAFGKGTERFSLPEVAGVPIGGNVPDVYFLLQMHYTNEKAVSGVHDNSGFRFWHTSKLRPNDAAMLTVGNTLWQMEVPPGQTRYLVNGHCSEGCLNKILPKSGINIIDAQAHSHTHGRAYKVRHFRNNKELPYISSDEHFDYTKQLYRTLPEARKLLPGDQITMECFFSTDDTKVTVLGGNPTYREMCFVFMYFYPAFGHPVCWSAPIGGLLTGLLGVGTSSTFDITYPQYLAGKPFDSYSESFDWVNNTYIRAAEIVTTIGPQVTLCTVNNVSFPVGNARYPDNLDPYVKPDPESVC